jgi:hypothetical protein
VITSSLLPPLALTFFLEMAQKYADTQLVILLKCCQNSPVSHLGHAALYLQQLFELNKVDTTFLRGWAMFLRGTGQIPDGIAMSVRCSMETLISISVPEDRFVFKTRLMAYLTII